MTIKNIGDPPLEGDRYTSPEWLIRQLVDELLPHWLDPTLLPVGSTPGTILDAGAGSGVFVRHLRRAYPTATIHAIDIHQGFGSWRDAGADLSFHGDFLTDLPPICLERPGTFLLPKYDLIVGNPPFSLAEAFIRRALGMCDYLAYVLRQGFLASKDRCALDGLWLELAPEYLYQVAHRPLFRLDKKSGDSADYMWFCWSPRRGPEYARREPRLRWLSTVPKADRKRLLPGGPKVRRIAAARMDRT